MRSLTTGFAAVAILLGTTALTTPAFATGAVQDHTCQGNANCSTTTNNYDNDTTYNKGGTGYGGNVENENYNDSHNKAYGGNVENENYNDSHNKAYGGKVENENYNDSHNKAYGGDGGSVGDVTNDSHNKAYGGDGGDAKAYGGDAKAYGGKVEHSGNSKIEDSGNSKIEDSGNSYVDNHNKNYQDQEQKQKQQQHQSIKDSGNSYNENDNSNSNNAEQEVNVNTYNQRAPVNTAYAAGLSVGEDTCMGSSSFGAQAVSFGLSIGTTWQDDNCRRLKNSRQLVALGYHRASTALMCVDEDVKNAMIMAGTPCPNGEVAAVYVAPTREVQTMAPVADEHRAPARKRKHRRVQPPK
jgi:hypothetical protein